MRFGFSSFNSTRWLLLGSLCLNIMLATYVSLQWFERPWSPAGAGIPLRMVERVADRLPKDDAEILWRVYREKEPEMQPLQADYVRALLKAMRLIGQTELNKQALHDAVIDARDKRIKIGDIMIETFVDALDRISPKGRRQLIGGFLR